MYQSGEIRWFFEGAAPTDVYRWFEGTAPVRHEPARTHEYLMLPACRTTSIKLRQGRLEVKALVTPPEPVDYSFAVSGLRDTWVKWSSGAIDIQRLRTRLQKDADQYIAVTKERRLRLFSLESGTPEEVGLTEARLQRGCQVELTSIDARLGGTFRNPSAMWWTLAFEAFGEPTHLLSNLDAAATAVFRREPPIRLDQTDSYSYPVWLTQIAASAGNSTSSAGDKD